MMGKVDAQGSMMQMISLEDLVPQDHFLRKLDAVLNLGFVPDFLQAAYPSNVGQPGVDPVLAVRMILLSYLYDLSDGRVCGEVRLHAGYRWFCRLDFHQPVPHRTTLVKFRSRCRKHDLWEELFHRIVAQCGEVGLLSGRHLMADSTQVAANASIKSMREIESDLIETAERLCTEDPPADRPQQDDDHHHTDFHGKSYSNKTHRSASDPDAQFYRKGKGKEAKLSFKVHTLADTKSRVIVATSATRVSGNDASDGAQALSLLRQASETHGIKPKTLCADTMYGNAKTITALYNTEIEPHIPLLCKMPPEIPSWKRRTFNIEHFGKRKEKLAQAMALNRAAELPNSKAYKISRKLRHRIEHLFGEAKQSHGLSRARYRGVAKMNEQATLTAIAQNLKRLVKHLNKPKNRLPNEAAVRPKSPVFRLYSIFQRLQLIADTVFNLFPSLLSQLANQPALQKG